MKTVLTLLCVSIMMFIMTVAMFGVSEKTSAQIDKEIIWMETHQTIRH